MTSPAPSDPSVRSPGAHVPPAPGPGGGAQGPAPLDPFRRPGAQPIRAVYVHAPFCARRCFYCDFAVTVSGEGRVEEWLDALAGEWRSLGAEDPFRPEAPLDSLYVGGGTPSLLGPTAMEGLAGVLGDAMTADPDLEWTAEANPESFTPELAAAWREAGVNRVSLGVQSFHEESLRWMGRLHGPDGALRAVDTARAAGLHDLSVDLMFGLPARLERPWDDDLDRVLALEVPHVSLYGLTVEEATPLGRAVREGREKPPEAEGYAREYLAAVERLTGAGYVQYEVSNFARPGHAARHNQVYWDGRPYLGLGNGAHSYRHPVRRWNPRDWNAYRRKAEKGVDVEDSRESLGPAQARLETVWLGLRTWRGLDLSGPVPAEARALAASWEERGLAVVSDGVVRLTAPGWLELDGLAVDLDRALGDPGDR